VVTAVLLVAAGCGPGTLPRAEYAQQAASICAQLHADIEDAGRSVSAETGAELVRAGAAANQLRRQAVEELRALGDPDEDAETVRAMIAAMEEQVDKLEAADEALADGDPGRMVELIEEAGEANREARRLAEGLGIAPCAG